MFPARSRAFRSLVSAAEFIRRRSAPWWPWLAAMWIGVEREELVILKTEDGSAIKERIASSAKGFPKQK